MWFIVDGIASCITKYTLKKNLLERDETRRVSGTNTGTTVLNGLVRDTEKYGNVRIDHQMYKIRSYYLRELSKVVADHLRLDFNLVEDLSVVDSNNRADHLGNNDHVTEMSLDNGRLLARGSLLLGSTELLNETHGLALQSALESSASTAVDKIHEL